MGLWSSFVNVVTAPVKVVKAVVTPAVETVKAGGIKAAAVVVGAAAAGTTFVGTTAVVVNKYIERKTEIVMGEGAKGNLYLVNGTDKDWVITGKPHSYQMNQWDNSFPQTIKAGQTQIVPIEFAQALNKTLTDSGAEITYQIAGTDQSFEIQARVKGNELTANFGDKYTLQVDVTNLNIKDKVRDGTNSDTGKPKYKPISLGWDDKGWRYFIVAGKDGSYVGNGLDTANWMRDNLSWIGDRRLTEICIPGSHDSGMSEKTWTVDGSAESTILTHTKNIAGQLKLGARFLDIRPVSLNGTYYTAHMQKKDVMGLVKVVGGTGQKIDDVIKELNDFTDTHNELVILNLSHAINVNKDDLNTTPPDFDQSDWNAFLYYLKANIKNLVVGEAGEDLAKADLSRMKLNQLLKNNKKVIILLAQKTFSRFNGNLQKDEDIPLTMPTDLHGKGFFTTTDNFSIYDSYANKKNWGEMAKDQFMKMNFQGFQYFLLSWTLTQQWDDGGDQAKNIIGTSKTILQLAQEANWFLPEIYAGVSPATFPNIIYTDDIRDDQQTAMAMAINWKRTIFPGYIPKPLVVVCENPDFSGTCDDFSELGKLLPIDKNVKNDKASSIKVPGGYKVTLYENTDGSGSQVVIDGDTEYELADLYGIKDLSKSAKSPAFDEIASSLKIEKKSTAPATTASETPAAPQTAETKAFANSLVGEWSSPGEITKFTESRVEFKRVNQDQPYNTSAYRVVNEKTVEFTSGGVPNKATITFEDNGNTLIWFNHSENQTYKLTRVKPN